MSVLQVFNGSHSYNSRNPEQRRQSKGSEHTESHIVIRLLLGLLLLLLGLLGGNGTTGGGGSSSGSTTSGDGSELGGTLSDELEERLKKSHG